MSLPPSARSTVEHLLAARFGVPARVEQDRPVGSPALLGELDALHGEWQVIGRPEMRRFRLRFIRAHAGVAPAPAARSAAGPWLAPGTYYHRQFVLAPGQSA